MAPPLSLYFAVAQASAAVISLGILVATQTREQAVKLPIFAGEPLSREQTAVDEDEELDGGDKADPFDVSIPLDFLDGIPIDEDKFWDEVSIDPVLFTNFSDDVNQI
jgi:hypothetical protein